MSPRTWCRECARITGSGDVLNGSHLLAAGVPFTDVSKRLGYVNPHVTATVYAQRIARPGMIWPRKAWEKFQNAGRIEEHSMGRAAKPRISTSPRQSRNWRKSAP